MQAAIQNLSLTFAAPLAEWYAARVAHGLHVDNRSVGNRTRCANGLFARTTIESFWAHNPLTFYRYLAQYREQPLDLLGCVIVNETNP
jgi:hypothetical protein